jgi:NAD(P)-dependent dehydrogenase (short-subunit alcohol dehydrogenase family)
MATETKRALIIGASRGLGLGLARELASRGVEVTATARDLDKATGLRDLPASSRLETLDIDDDAAVDALAGRLQGQTFDIVFINAGVTGPSHESADLATTEEIGKLFATNAVSPIRLARKLLGNIKPETGTLAFMSSVLGSIAANTTGSKELYRASKTALNSLIKSFVLGLDEKNKKITVLTVHPGWVRTDMGGPEAPLDVATSVREIANQLEKRAGKGGLSFIDYQGEELPW